MWPVEHSYVNCIVRRVAGSIVTRQSKCTFEALNKIESIQLHVSHVPGKDPPVQNIVPKDSRIRAGMHDVYDMAIMVKLAHPKTSTYDMINLIPDWRREFNLKGAAVMHEAAALQARRAVIAFWKSNSRKHARRVRHKNEIRQGKRTRYKHNRWTDPSSLLRRHGKSERLMTLSCRREPKIKGNDSI